MPPGPSGKNREGGAVGTHRVGPSTEIGGSFPLDPRAPEQARRLLASLRGLVPPEVMIDLALVVSEMVTNSVKHSGRSDRHVDVSALAGPDVVRVEVRDPGPGFEPIPRRAVPRPGAGGWGLFILDRLATRWGTKPGGVVWAELAYPATGLRLAG